MNAWLAWHLYNYPIWKNSHGKKNIVTGCVCEWSPLVFNTIEFSSFSKAAKKKKNYQIKTHKRNLGKNCVCVCVCMHACMCIQRALCWKLMNYISISQLLAAVTFFGVLASICSMYGNIFFLISKVYVFNHKKKLVSQKNVKIHLFKNIYITFQRIAPLFLPCAKYYTLAFEMS